MYSDHTNEIMLKQVGIVIFASLLVVRVFHHFKGSDTSFTNGLVMYKEAHRCNSKKI